MSRPDNYQTQAKQAKERFLTYDQEALIRKLALPFDEGYLYPVLLSQPYRICRKTGDMERKTSTGWQDANSFAEVMTLLDLICDSRENRYVSGRWKNMTSFGLMFHKNLLEDRRNPWADLFQENPQGFRKACLALGGQPFPNGDIAYTLDFFDGLPITLQLWFGDEEFPPNLRLLWDENALQYIKYETMHFARGLILDRIREGMDANQGLNLPFPAI